MSVELSADRKCKHDFREIAEWKTWSKEECEVGQHWQTDFLGERNVEKSNDSSLHPLFLVCCSQGKEWNGG
jgi:hypothetical protein